MMRQLQHLRDFLNNEEQLKWLPGNLRVENCMLLTQHKKDNQGVTRTVLQVFDERGTYIGEITNPDFIPNEKS